MTHEEATSIINIVKKRTDTQDLEINPDACEKALKEIPQEEAYVLREYAKKIPMTSIKIPGKNYAHNGSSVREILIKACNHFRFKYGLIIKHSGEMPKPGSSLPPRKPTIDTQVIRLIQKYCEENGIRKPSWDIEDIASAIKAIQTNPKNIVSNKSSGNKRFYVGITRWNRAMEVLYKNEYIDEATYKRMLMT